MGPGGWGQSTQLPPPLLGPVRPALPTASSSLVPTSPASSPSAPASQRAAVFFRICRFCSIFSKQRQLYSEQMSSKIDSQQRENMNQHRNASRLQAALHLGANGHSFPLGCGQHPEKAGRHGDASIAAAARVEMTQTASELSSRFGRRFLPYSDLMAWWCEHPMLFSPLMTF